ncbi:hypothetical protein [Methylotenera sp.]|uniref:hypothetical protein n=1 Tax=Methylotenera sp. TaxID=2051956 RepID=UPI002EDA9F23
MRTRTALALGAVAGLAGLGVSAYLYRKGVDKLQFQLQGFSFMQSGAVRVVIAVINPNDYFAYPVPRIDLGVFDSQDKYLGNLRSSGLQWIYKYGISYLVAYIHPNYAELINTLTGAALGTVPLELNLTGNLYVSNLSLPIDTTLKLSTNGL